MAGVWGAPGEEAANYGIDVPFAVPPPTALPGRRAMFKLGIDETLEFNGIDPDVVSGHLT